MFVSLIVDAKVVVEAKVALEGKVIDIAVSPSVVVRAEVFGAWKVLESKIVVLASVVVDTEVYVGVSSVVEPDKVIGVVVEGSVFVAA